MVVMDEKDFEVKNPCNFSLRPPKNVF